MCQSDIETYAEQICSNAKIVSAWCAETGRPYPSFDPQAPSVTIPADAPEKILRARQTIITAAAKVQQLASEPVEYLVTQAINYQLLTSLHFLAHFRILSFIPLHGSLPYTSLASVASVPATLLTTLCRIAITSNFLCEPITGEVAHNAASTLFVTRPWLLDWGLFMCEVGAQSARATVAAVEAWGNITGKGGESCWGMASGKNGNFEDAITNNAEMREMWEAYSRGMAGDEDAKGEFLASKLFCDWDGASDCMIVDIGNAVNSTPLIYLLSQYSALKLTVQDAPNALKIIQSILNSQPESLRIRVTCTPVANPFSTPKLPPTPKPGISSTIILLRHVLGTLNDEDAISVLIGLIPAIKSGARLVLVETVMPDRGLGLREEQVLRARELGGWQLGFGSAGRERREGEWRELIKSVVGGDGTVGSKGAGMLAVKKVGRAGGGTGLWGEMVLEVGLE